MLVRENEWPESTEVVEKEAKESPDNGATKKELLGSQDKVRKLKGLALETALYQMRTTAAKCVLDFGAEAASVDLRRLLKTSWLQLEASPPSWTAASEFAGVWGKDDKQEGGLWQDGKWEDVLIRLMDVRPEFELP